MQLVSARICNLAGTVCDTVAALNSAALVTVVGENIGALDADYTVSLGNCTYPTQPIAAQSVALSPGEQKSLAFEVRLPAWSCGPHAALGPSDRGPCRSTGEVWQAVNIYWQSTQETLQSDLKPYMIILRTL